MGEPKYIKTWRELSEQKSETHILEIDLKYGGGWLISKDGSDQYYLSTHAFYGFNHSHSTYILQACGFNVIIANWDA